MKEIEECKNHNPVTSIYSVTELWPFENMDEILSIMYLKNYWSESLEIFVTSGIFTLHAFWCIA